MEKSESIKELATALCKFQGSVEKIKKTSTNPFFKSKYANLADILDVIREPLFESGLSFVQFPKGQHELETMLMHVSGEWMKETYQMTPTKNDPQGLGSVITYQRRYALGSILGLNIDEDDDGNKASAKVDKNATGIKPQPKIDVPEMDESVLQSIKNALSECKSQASLKKMWEANPEIQKNATFIKMVTDRKKVLTENGIE